uniref:SCYLLA-like protein n=1 Tax=Panagrellus redivivus TaxID=6233 RepID=A0A7E4ZRS2_PANRE
MSASSTEPPIAVAANWHALKPLEESLYAAADRLNLKKSKQLVITIGGNRKSINIHLDGADRIPGKRQSPIATQTELKPEKKYADASTQTEGPPSPGTMLISVMAFAPFELKKGMQIKAIQVGIADPAGGSTTAVATAAT